MSLWAQTSFKLKYGSPPYQLLKKNIYSTSQPWLKPCTKLTNPQFVLTTTIEMLFKSICQEPKSCSLVATMCSTFSYLKVSCKTLTELPKHLHFWTTLDDPIYATRPSSFLKFDFKSTYMPLFNPSDEPLHQITVPMLTEKEYISDDVCSWSDELCNELLYEVAAWLSDEEWENKLNTYEIPATLLQPPYTSYSAKRSFKPL